MLRFAEPSKLASILTEVGAIDVREQFLKFDIEAPISPDEFWELRSATSATLREKLGQMKFPAQMIIVSARKS